MVNIILLILGFQVDAQKISGEKCISCNFDYPLNEPHLVVNPQDLNHLLIGAIATKSWAQGSEPDSYIVLYQSTDGGKSWEIKQFDKGIGLGADPWLGINNRGTVVLSSLSKIDDLNGVYLTAHISKDAGNTWLEDYHNFGFSHDRQSMVVDTSSSEFIIVSAKANRNSEDKNIWGIAINRLSAGGSLIESTWHEISNIDKMNGTPILINGLLLVPYVDYMANNQMLDSKRSWIIKSNDKGKTFKAPILLSEKGTLPKVAMGKNGILYYLRLQDGSSRAELQYSSDNGYTWKSMGDLISYEDQSTIVKTPEIMVNPKGIIGVFWHELNKHTNTYQLKCTFGNEDHLQFAEPMNVASQQSKADPNANGMVDKRWPTGGDYFGLTTLPNGNFVVVWVDHRNGKPQLFKAIVDFLDK
ncbi:MAG: sialidase family protein [Bacteroidota bacterium]